MTPPVLNNDKRLFKLGGVIQVLSFASKVLPE